MKRFNANVRCQDKGGPWWTTIVAEGETWDGDAQLKVLRKARAESGPAATIKILSYVELEIETGIADGKAIAEGT